MDFLELSEPKEKNFVPPDGCIPNGHLIEHHPADFLIWDFDGVT